jgi:predicted acylesterase/phospholipase RssA
VADKKIALVLSGGSSLGAYIAGALDELLEALRQTDEFEIDVIVGASAGAVGAAVIAHGLLYRDGVSLLHRVWVDQFDIVDLLDPRPNTDEKQVSLLSDRLLLDIQNEARAWPEPNNPGQRAPFCADRLVVGFALSNTTPLAYEAAVRQPTARGDEPFVQFHYAEQESFWFDAAVAPTDRIWERVCQVAQASGAIPFAFPLVKLQGRDPGKTTLDAGNREQHFLQQPRTDSLPHPLDFYYYDGGTYNNLPLDLCEHHITTTLGCPEDDPNRFIYVVNPWRQTVSQVEAPGQAPVLLKYARTLYSGLRTEASAIQFDDDALARDAAMGPGLERAQIARRLPGASPTAYGGGGSSADRAPREMARAGVGPPSPSLLARFALVMPGEQQGMSPIRGYHLGALGAFLDWRFREYDYRRGAADAREVIQQRLGIRYERPNPAFYRPDADDELYPRADLSQYLGLEGIPSSRPDRQGQYLRGVFEDALRRRLDWVVPQATQQLGVPLLSLPFVPRLLKSYVWGKVQALLPDYWANEQAYS